MKFRSGIPIFRSFDEAKMRAFYIDYLGFEMGFEHRFEEGWPLYCGLILEDCVIHMSEHHGDATPGSAVRVEVDDLQALHAKLKSRGYERVTPDILDQSWGYRELILIDPFGNRVVLCQELKRE